MQKIIQNQQTFIKTFVVDGNRHQDLKFGFQTKSPTREKAIEHPKTTLFASNYRDEEFRPACCEKLRTDNQWQTKK